MSSEAGAGSASGVAVAAPEQHLGPQPRGLSRAPASFTQERLWFMSRYDTDSQLYNSPAFIRLTGPVSPGALETALNRLAERHDVLRTVFESSTGGLMQTVRPFQHMTLQLIDLQDFPAQEREAQADAMREAEAAAPFDLAAGPLMRAQLLRLQPEQHLLLLVLHHTIFDGWSRAILLDELSELYQAALSDRPAQLEPLPLQYTDFAVWQRERLRGESMERLVSFWREELDGISNLSLETDQPRSMDRTFAGATMRFQFAPELRDGLKAVARSRRATFFPMLMSALQVLLHRHTDQDDFAVGFPVAGRTHVELEPLIGPFINALVLRADFAQDMPFTEFLDRQRRRVLQVMTHQDLPFEQLLQELHVERDLSRAPIFQILMQLRNMPRSEPVKGGLRWQYVTASRVATQFDMAFEMSDNEAGLAGKAIYNSDLFSEDSVRRMVEHYENLLTGIVRQPDQKISKLPLLGEAERRQLLVDFNNTAEDYPSEKGVHDLFREQAARTPDADAVAVGNRTMTYREVDLRSEALAEELRRHGVGPDVPVGLHVARDFSMPVAFMAVLKAGGACLPLDPVFPPDRLGFMIGDAAAPVVLTTHGLPKECEVPPDVQVVNLQPWMKAPAKPVEWAPPAFSPDQIAYITYTSGSTGKPKGVAVPHRGCVSLLNWAHGRIYNPETVQGVLHSTSITFDVGVWLIYVSLTQGGCLIIPESLMDLILRPPQRPVTLIDAVPSALIELLRQNAIPKTVHTVILGGETASGSLVRRLYDAGARQVINQYGPTEITVACTSDTLPRECPEHPTIGRAVANNSLYVLDKYGNPAPLGSRGELYVGGVGVARGYVGRSELTSERFLPDPFSDQPGARMYRTGDFVKYEPDGSLQFLGRADSQVKLRGCRIELDEVQAVLLEHPKVAQAGAIVWKEAPGGPALTAYVALAPQAKATADELREHLRERLPEFMVPSYFSFLETLPLRSSGKLNTDVLPPPQVASEKVRSKPAEEHATHLERQLQEVFAEVLETDHVGLDDNFFALGGHSLLAARLFARLLEKTGYAPPLPLLFRAPTIRRFAQAIASGESLPHGDCLVPIKVHGNRPPLFCAHHETGEAFCYVLLSEYLAPDQPVYGIRAPDDLDDPDLTLEKLADNYLKAMREVQPEGPYHLFGYSQAAKLAYLLAVKLQEAGQDVAYVGLVDYPADFRAYRRPRFPGLRHPLQALADLPWTVAYDGCMTRQEQKQEWRNRARELAAFLGLRPHRPRFHEDDSDRRRRLDGLLKAYQPASFFGDIVLYRCRQQNLLCTHHRLMGWNDLVSGRVNVVPIPGMHVRAMHDPFVQAIARDLNKRLQGSS